MSPPAAPAPARPPRTRLLTRRVFLPRRARARQDEVEAAFYRAYAPRLAGVARVPALLRAAAVGASGERLLALEDLDAAGYAARVCRGAVADAHVRACLRWLARLHATFLARAGAPRPGLWETGCYWHLGTRPEELAAMEDCALKRAAPAIDRRLAAVRWVTIVHGDAKLANFCFPCPGSVGEGEGDVAAVDFQYCGGGVGVRDVAYLLGSCLDEEGLERDVERLLVAYFAALRAAAKHVCEDDQNAVEAEWRALWPWAVADFERFLAGWAPRHWKMNRYTARLADKVAQSCAP